MFRRVAASFAFKTVARCPVSAPTSSCVAFGAASSFMVQQRFNSAASAEAALAIAKSVNALKRQHQAASQTERKAIELKAWAELQTLTEEQCSSGEGQAVALLLNGWAYFSKFWSHGQDGPHGDAGAQS